MTKIISHSDFNLMINILNTSSNITKLLYHNNMYKNILFDSIGDIHPVLGIQFKNCENVYFNNCDKNFIFYYMTPSVFPNIKKIYLGSHPCDYDTQFRFNKGIISVIDFYKRYIDINHCSLISNLQYLDIIINTFNKKPNL